ncbi:unnamed protein product [Polarella glacialis]|uniref:Uncharacterized protein n=1 Tax=Polarella glacialis TaxID=89957 RepID=A0A813FFP6_POLGL|nr:unnamed protein product [Polarella glacialis]
MEGSASQSRFSVPGQCGSGMRTSSEDRNTEVWPVVDSRHMARQPTEPLPCTSVRQMVASRHRKFERGQSSWITKAPQEAMFQIVNHLIAHKGLAGCRCGYRLWLSCRAADSKGKHLGAEVAWEDATNKAKSSSKQSLWRLAALSTAVAAEADMSCVIAAWIGLMHRCETTASIDLPQPSLSSG